MAIITGTAGDDTLRDTDGNDQMYGGAGNDVLTSGGYGGADQLDGGEGDDTLQFRNGFGPGELATGGPGEDRLVTAGEILGAAVDGLETIVLTANTTVDQALLDQGVSFANSEARSKKIFIVGAVGDFSANSTSGPIVLWGRSIVGTGGDDHITGSAPRSAVDLAGGEGDDTLVGFAFQAADRFDGGPGLDTLVVDTTRGFRGEATLVSIERLDLRDHFAWLTEAQFAQFQAFTGNGFRLEAATEGGTYDLGSKLISGTGSFRGSAGADTVLGSAGADTLIGRDGGDRLEGREGDDRLWGGAGEDVIMGGGGADSLNGEDGGDSVSGGAGDDVVSASWGDALDGGAGVDLVSFAGQRMPAEAILSGVGPTSYRLNYSVAGTLTGFENATGSPSADHLQGGGGANLLDGAGGDDRVNGGGGGDVLAGGLGDDLLYGSLGDDRLDGGEGADTLEGGPGDDTLDGGLGDDVLRGGAGDDLFTESAGHPPSGTPFGVWTGFNRVDGGDGGDAISFHEAAAGVVATLSGSREIGFSIGGVAAGTLIRCENAIGAEWGDRFQGGGGDNTLEGRGGGDVLNGGGGDDRLAGGAGNDFLTGSQGADRFVFLAAEGTLTTRDHVSDLSLAQHDSLEFAGFSFASAADVLAAASQQGSDTVLDLGAAGILTLAGFEAADLARLDMVFA
jgi:Ca2+-binding RTX toxin-like protein